MENPESAEGTVASEKENKETKNDLNNYSTFCLSNVEEMSTILTGLSLADFTPVVEQELYSMQNTVANGVENASMQSPLSVSRTMACSICSTSFVDRSEQILHYKLDWHRFNLKLKLQGEKPISEEKFVEVSGNISSLSGSDSDDAEKSDGDTSSSDVYSSPQRRRLSALPHCINSPIRRERSASVTSTDTETDESERPDKTSVTQSRLQPKLYFRNQFHKIIALYRCVVHGKQNVPKNQPDLLNIVTAIPNQMYWAIILIGGGHFAAAVYNQSEIILHKTFHRYTVRAKQGSAQSSRDGKHGGSQPKSAGASLRRHNEASLVKDIQDLLQSWNTDLQKCSCIFYRAPSFNRVTLFRGKNPPFKKDDCRLRNIPFPTRRATFNEVKRVYGLLSTLECFGDVSEEDKQIPKSPKVYLGSKKVKKKSSDSSLDRGNLDKNQDSENSKSGKQRVRKPATNKKEGYKYKTEGIVLAEEKSELSDSKLSDLDNSMEFQLVEETITTSDLKEMTVPKRRKHKSRKNSLTKRQQDPAMDVLSEENYHMKSALYTACQTGDLQELEKLLNILKSRMLPVDTKKEDLHDTCNSSQNSITLRNCDKVQAEESGMHDDSTSNIEIENNSNESLKQDETKVHFSVDDDKEMKLDFSPVQNGNPKPNRILNMDLSGSKPSKRRNKSGTGGEFNSPLLTVDVLNEVISDGGATLLHVATKEGHQGIVKMLMECGANPTLRDKRGLTPYMASNDREMRNVYRRFMAENPNRFDYKSAEIPSPLSEEMMAERLEKKKEKQKLRKERLKEKKAVEMQKKFEEEEKKRYLSLSDREKRALAAERRYLGHLSQTGQPTVVLSRCFQCGVDITGKTPFEYNDSRFCSTDCVKSHRKCRKS